MNCRLVFATVALCAFTLASPLLRAEPKAYDLVHYQGKTAGFSVALDFAYGYPQASTLKIIAGKKAAKYQLDGSEKMHFIPAPGASGAKEVDLQMGLDDEPPATVAGTYKDGDKTTPFTLTKRK